MTAEACIGCGGKFEAIDGPVHRYMTSSPACWAAFGRVLAAEYADDGLLSTCHRLSVDTYAIQHPGDTSRQATQSVWFHLARLMLQLERQMTPAQTNEVMVVLTSGKRELAALTPPASFEITVADVAPLAGHAQHRPAVEQWARGAWDAWIAHHDRIRAWTSRTVPPVCDRKR